jgi:predicted transposase/invertase (TIGR01784 family)
MLNEHNMAVAKDEGLQKGLQQGLQQGIKQGLQKGLLEKAISTAKTALKLMLPIEQIMQLTGLSEEEISKLSPA